MPLSRFITVLPAAVLGFALVAPAADAAVPAPPAVGHVDIDRYLGTWYQIAAVPQPFESHCAKNVKARYTLTGAGTVSVRNGCTTWQEDTSSLMGEAKVLDSSGARLNVSFSQSNGSYRHGANANYIVSGLDPEYRWAVVTDSKRRTGFVLSRTPFLPAGQQMAVGASIGAAGLDVCAFRITRQDGGSRTTGQLC